MQDKDRLDIETTAKPATTPLSASASTSLPKPLAKPVAAGGLDIETTVARPRTQPPSTPRQPVAQPPAPQPAISSDGQAVFPVGYVLDGKFVLTKVLGKGGIGIVYKATERETGVEFAIKVLSPELVNDAEARADLKKEVANAQRLTHQNLLKVNYLADAGPTTYVVMECIDGENLEEYRVRKGGKIGLDDFRKIVPQVLAALDYLHEKGVVHCDVKPQNIMITPGGEVKLTDYGIARTIKEQLAREAASQMSAGTLAYMAPEQIRGDGVCDRRADIYSAGMMFHRLVTGEFPFDTKDRQAVLRWHIDEKHAIHGTGASALDGIIGKALCVVLAGRYQTCAAMLDDLRRAGILNDASAIAPAAPTVETSPIENLLQLTRLTRQLMTKRPFELLFVMFNQYPRVHKKGDGSYELIKSGQGLQSLKAMFGTKVHPAEELANEMGTISARGIALDHRLQHNVNALLTEAEGLQSKTMSAMAYRGIAIGSAIVVLLLLLAVVGPIALGLWPFWMLVAFGIWGMAARRQLLDDIIHRLKKPQSADMY